MIEEQQYTLAAIRTLVTEALSDEELNILCYDHFHPVYEQFSATQSRVNKIQILVEYCDRQMAFPKLLEEINKYNPARYKQFITRYVHKVIGLEADDVITAEITPKAVQQEYSEIQRDTISSEETQIEGFEDFQFQDREKLRAKILQSKANHIELFGPSGVGKTYVLKHIANGRENIQTTYIDLSVHSTVTDILPEIITQLSGARSRTPLTLANLARSINDLYQANKLVNHFLFLFDSATEAHQETIDWLISRDGLINHHQFPATLRVVGIRKDDIKLQVVIAAQRPLVRIKDYHTNLRFEPCPMDRLKKSLDPNEDPIQGMLRELAKHSGFPIAPGPCQEISDEVYYLTGGHPKCAKAVLFAVADADFVPDQAQWKLFFETYVLPTIRQEMLGSIPDFDLAYIIWILSIFRHFDQRILLTLLERQVLPNAPGGRDASRQARLLRKRLVDTYLVNEPTREEAICTINFTVRHALALSMQYHFPSRFRAINGLALEIFTERLQSTQIGLHRSVSSLIEIAYHWFKAIEVDPTVKADDICDRIQQALQEHFPLLLGGIEKVDWPDCLLLFKDSWAADEALQETARRATRGTECYESLTRFIKEFVDEFVDDNVDNT